MKRILILAALVLISARADAGILYEQPPNPNGASYGSAWWEPDGSNYDLYIWDAFTSGYTATINSIEWRGTYGASGSPSNFTVAIYASIPAGSQPDFSQPPLFEYETGGNAGQTYAGVFGGVTMYDYSFTLPTPFPVQMGVRYWVQIEGWQSGFPDWSLSAGLGGDGTHFLCEHNNIPGKRDVPTGCWFTTRTGDTAFRVITSTPLAVDDGAGSGGVGLSGALPNPSRGDQVNVAFSLPNSAPAELALFDAGGRLVTQMRVDVLGAGPHLVDLARIAPIGPGVYFIRLMHGGRGATTRVAVVR